MPEKFTVFVCSTYADLAEERERVLDAIRRLQLQHDSMDFFGARPNLPIETCLAEVRRSDALVVIVGHRYGSLVPGFGISFSEAEYREGHRLGKPCLVYVRDENVPVVPRHIERDPDKVRLLEAWKNDLASRHTLATFTDSQHLAIQVAADLSRTIQALEEARRSVPEPTGSRSNALGEINVVVREALENGVSEGTLVGILRRAVADFLSRTGKRAPNIFLSYSHDDSVIVRAVAEQLLQAGYDVWFDEAAVMPGDSLVARIERGLDTADVVVFFLSQASTRSQWARQELNVAIARQVTSARRTVVIPVLLDDCEIPALLKDVLYLDMRHEDVDSGVKRLIASIERHQMERLEARETPVNRYFNPPQRVRVVGRKLKGETYHDLSTQLLDEEVLIGLYRNKADAVVATHLSSEERMNEMESRWAPSAGYYAVPRAEANAGFDQKLT
jgi:hypothetical protein